MRSAHRFWTVVSLLTVSLLTIPIHAVVVASVLPTSRSVQVTQTATAFATIINGGTETATNCGMAPVTTIDAAFTSRLTDPATNLPIEPLVERADIAPGAFLTFVFGFTPNSAFPPTNVEIAFDCDNTDPAAVTVGLNTLQLSASDTAVPDIVALAATLASDGVVRSPGTAGTGVFSVATVNVGVDGTVTVAPSVTGGAQASAFVCETNPVTGACISPIGASVETTIAAGATPTFGIFVAAAGRTAPDPANVRVSVSINDGGGVSRGATSVAFQTQTELALGGGTLQFDGVAVTASPNDAIAPVDIDVVEDVAPPAAVPGGFGAVDTSQNVTVSDTNRLDSPLTMTFDYDDSVVPDDDVIVLHYNPVTQRYEPTTMLAVDSVANTVTVDSREFSSFVITSLDGILPSAFDVTGFSAANNAWNIANFGSYFAPSGNCLGMSGYATWFFKNQTGNLNGFFSTDGGAPISVAHLTATRAHLAQSQYWAITQFRDMTQIPPALLGRIMKASLALFDEPLILLLGINGSPRHATVLYGYDATGFKHYEVNTAPGATRSFVVPFDGTSFGTYGTYNTFAFVAAPSLGRSDDFGALTMEAQSGFAASNDLVISEPVQDAVITERDTQLSGVLEGALAGGRDVVAYVNGESTPLGTDVTSFSTTIPVKAGENTLIVLAGDFDGQNRWSKNAATRVVSFNADILETLFRATLTWNRGDFMAPSDVDLYVIEPGGNDAAWWDNTITSAGLELDFDNQIGFGPENITLEEGDTVIPGLYDVRVHYWDGPAPVSGQVQILLNEGASDQVNQVVNWTINVPGDEMAGPTANTAAWTNIADVDVVNGVVTPD